MSWKQKYDTLEAEMLKAEFEGDEKRADEIEAQIEEMMKA